MVLIDLDGTLIDMSPFADELDDPDDKDRWRRFFAHTLQAKPIPEGVELVAALSRIGARYSIFTTRLAAMHRIIRQRPMINEWVAQHLAAPPKWIFFRSSVKDAAITVMRGCV